MPWETMKHNGVNLAPVYYPTGVVRYKGSDVKLTPLCEEYLVYWFRLKQVYRKDPVIIENFLKTLRKIGKMKLSEDFLNDKGVMAQFMKLGKNFKTYEKVSNLVKIDNTVYTVNNSVDIPGIFIGKGSHPLRGCIKLRVEPSDITMNGTCPKRAQNGERWKSCVQSKDSFYIACWKDQLFNKNKYIYATSDEETKYNECYKLKKYIHRIRRMVEQHMTSPDFKIRKLGCIVYLIDKLCFRVGHEKDETSSDSVGVCTLLGKNVKVISDNKVEFDFFGKSYIRYKRRVVLCPSATNVLIEALDSNKSDEEELFDTSATSVNAYLQKLMPGLTAKMFRTFNASTLCSRLLKNKTTIEELKDSFVKVAQLCNHKRKKKNTYVIDAMTTKRNYIDPRIVFSYVARNNLNISSIYSDTLLEHHGWASSTPGTFIY